MVRPLSLEWGVRYYCKLWSSPACELFSKIGLPAFSCLLYISCRPFVFFAKLQRLLVYFSLHNSCNAHHSLGYYYSIMKFIACLLQVLVAATLASVASAGLAVVAYVEAPLDETEGVKIEAALNNLSGDSTRRGLRAPQDERDLFDRSRCYNWCSGWPYYQCYVRYSTCTYNARRQLDEISASEEEEDDAPRRNFRELSVNSPECQTKIRETFAAMQAAVSAGAAPIIQKSTKFICHEECMLNGFQLVNTDCDVVSRPTITDGALICKNDYQWSFEAIVDDCVASVKFVLKKDSVKVFDRVENQARYTLFGNNQGDYFGPSQVGLHTMDAGSYTLTATPDGDTELTKTIMFELMEC